MLDCVVLGAVGKKCRVLSAVPLGALFLSAPTGQCVVRKCGPTVHRLNILFLLLLLFNFDSTLLNILIISWLLDCQAISELSTKIEKNVNS